MSRKYFTLCGKESACVGSQFDLSYMFHAAIFMSGLFEKAKDMAKVISCVSPISFYFVATEHGPPVFLVDPASMEVEPSKLYITNTCAAPHV